VLPSIAEGDERAPRLNVNVAGLRAVLDEFSPTHYTPPCGLGGISVILVPSTMEHADPGGVSGTTRSASLT
jgi:hypothetical protein